MNNFGQTENKMAVAINMEVDHEEVIKHKSSQVIKEMKILRPTRNFKRSVLCAENTAVGQRIIQPKKEKRHIKGTPNMWARPL